MSGVSWRIAPGDPTCVFVPGVAKPINCGSQERARLIAAAPDLLEAMRRELADLREQAETGLCSRSRDQRIDDMAAAVKRATEG